MIFLFLVSLLVVTSLPSAAADGNSSKLMESKAVSAACIYSMDSRNGKLGELLAGLSAADCESHASQDLLILFSVFPDKQMDIRIRLKNYKKTTKDIFDVTVTLIIPPGSQKSAKNLDLKYELTGTSNKSLMTTAKIGQEKDVTQQVILLSHIKSGNESGVVMDATARLKTWDIRMPDTAFNLMSSKTTIEVSVMLNSEDEVLLVSPNLKFFEVGPKNPKHRRPGGGDSPSTIAYVLIGLVALVLFCAIATFCLLRLTVNGTMSRSVTTDSTQTPSTDWVGGRNESVYGKTTDEQTEK